MGTVSLFRGRFRERCTAAYAAASVRLRRPSLARMLLTWCPAVLVLMNRRLRDLGVGQALGDEPEHLHLPFAQRSSALGPGASPHAEVAQERRGVVGVGHRRPAGRTPRARRGPRSPPTGRSGVDQRPGEGHPCAAGRQGQSRHVAEGPRRVAQQAAASGRPAAAATFPLASRASPRCRRLPVTPAIVVSRAAVRSAASSRPIAISASTSASARGTSRPGGGRARCELCRQPRDGGLRFAEREVEQGEGSDRLRQVLVGLEQDAGLLEATLEHPELGELGHRVDAAGASSRSRPARRSPTAALPRRRRASR